MKREYQALIEAATEAAENCYECRYDNSSTGMRIVKEAFIYGAQWQRKQPQWISVEDGLPNPGEEVLIYDSRSIRHYVIGWLREKKGDNESRWCLTNGFVEDGSVTHWMPIPSFDEILVANSDVLKRMKEYEIHG